MVNPLKKVFKKQEFYLELDEAETGKVESQAPAKQPEPPKAAATPEPAKQPKPAKSGAFGFVNKLLPTKTKDLYLELDEAETGKVKSQAPAKKQKTAKAKSNEPAKQPEPVQAAVATAQAAASTNGKAESESGLTFADKNLLPLPTSRRRPGPSMNMFRDMARGVKIPKSPK